MNSDNYGTEEMKSRWAESTDPRDRELDDRFCHAEIMTEDEMYEAAGKPFKVADFPTAERIMRQCKLTAEEYAHITSNRAFKRRYGIAPGLWNRFTPHVINYLRSFLLRDYSYISPAEAKRVKAERARLAAERYAAKYSAYAGMTPEEKAAAIKAKMSAGIKAAWATRKAKAKGEK